MNIIMGNICDKNEENEVQRPASEIVPNLAVTSTSAVTRLHADGVNCVVGFKGHILSGCKAGKLVVFDFENRRASSAYESAHSREVTKVCHRLSDSLLASCSRDKSVKLWRHEQGNLKLGLTFSDAHQLVVTGLDFCGMEQNHLITGSRDNFVKLWDFNTGQLVRSTSLSRNLVTHIRSCKNSHQFLQSGEDKELKLWDTRTLSVVACLPKKRYIQTCCDVSGDASQCVSSSNGFGGNGCEATLWDFRSKQPILEFVGHRESVLSVAYGNSDRFVITGSADSTARVWSTEAGRELAVCQVDSAGQIAGLCPVDSQNCQQNLDFVFAAATFGAGVCVCQFKQAGDSTCHVVSSY